MYQLIYASYLCNIYTNVANSNESLVLIDYNNQIICDKIGKFFLTLPPQVVFFQLQIDDKLRFGLNINDLRVLTL